MTAFICGLFIGAILMFVGMAFVICGGDNHG